MLARLLTIVSFAVALSFGLAAAAPAEATGPLGRQIANGTLLSGVSFEGRLPNWIDLMDNEFAIAADHLAPADVFKYYETATTAISAADSCPSNGTQLNGSALQEAMIARSLTIAALTAVLGLSACPVEAIGPWGTIANGTQLNGLAPQGVAARSTQEPAEDELGKCRTEGMCPKHGTQVNGIVLEGEMARRVDVTAKNGPHPSATASYEALDDDHADLSSCQSELCPRNGSQLDGLTLQGVTPNGARMQEPDGDERDCDEWVCGMNGTSFNGLALQLGALRNMEPEEDDADAIGGLCQSAGICPRNGTELNGFALRGVTLNGIRTQEPDEDDADAIGGLCQAEGICPKNGTRLNGVAFEGNPLRSLRMTEPLEHSGDAREVDESRPPLEPTPATDPVPSARDMLLQIQASPGGSQLLKEAEQRSAPVQNAMANTSTACEPPDCLQVTPRRPGIGSWGSYGLQIWGHNTTWIGQSSSFWLTAPGPAEPPRFQQGTPLLVAQSYDNRSGGWHVVTVELCKANHDGRFYSGPAVGRLFHGVDSSYPRRKLPSDATLLNTWQLTIGDTPLVGCHMFPTLVELTGREHSFVFELEVGDLLVQRVSLRKL